MVFRAARLKITKPALYYSFHNKEEILVECFGAGIAEIESHLERSSRVIPLSVAQANTGAAVKSRRRIATKLAKRGIYDQVRLLSKLSQKTRLKSCFENGELLLSRFAEWCIVPFCDLDARMAQQDRDLVERYSSEQKFYRKGVPKHMGMTTFRRSIRPLDRRKLKELPIGTLKTLCCAARISVS